MMRFQFLCFWAVVLPGSALILGGERFEVHPRPTISTKIQISLVPTSPLYPTTADSSNKQGGSSWNLVVDAVEGGQAKNRKEEDATPYYYTPSYKRKRVSLPLKEYLREKSLQCLLEYLWQEVKEEHLPAKEIDNYTDAFPGRPWCCAESFYTPRQGRDFSNWAIETAFPRSFFATTGDGDVEESASSRYNTAKDALSAVVATLGYWLEDIVFLPPPPPQENKEAEDDGFTRLYYRLKFRRDPFHDIAMGMGPPDLSKDTNAQKLHEKLMENILSETYNHLHRRLGRLKWDLRRSMVWPLGRFSSSTMENRSEIFQVNFELDPSSYLPENQEVLEESIQDFLAKESSKHAFFDASIYKG